MRTAYNQVPMSGENMKQNPLTEDFGVYVKELLNEWKVPGVSVAVVNGEETFSQVGLIDSCSPFPKIT